MKTTGNIFLLIIAFSMLFSCGKAAEPGTGGSPYVPPTGMTLTIAYPFPAETGFAIKGQTAFYASLKGTNEITKVEFYLDGVLKCTDVTGIFKDADFGTSYACPFDTSASTNGNHTLMVKSYDTNNKIETASISIKINNASTLSVGFTSPASDNLEYNSVAYPSDLNIQGTFSGITNPMIQLFIDGKEAPLNSAPSPFNYAWDISKNGNGTDKFGEKPGKHVLTVVITDPANLSISASATRLITIKDIDPPVVSLFSPGIGAYCATNFLISPYIQDNGTITEVELFLQKKGTGIWVTKNKLFKAPFEWQMEVNDTSLNGEYYVKFVVKDEYNTTTYDSSALPSPNSIFITYPTKVATISAEEGYITAQDGGINPSIGSDSTRIMLGHQTSTYYGKGIFSFDTSSLTGKTITRAYLEVEMDSMSGNPWALNTLTVDIKTGTFGSSALETSDWDAASTYSSIASFDSFTSGVKKSNDFDTNGLSSINKTGKTQLRTYFALNPTNAGDYIWLKRNKTVLYVEYY